MSEATDVVLSWVELRSAGHVGIDRHVRNIANRRPAAHGARHDDWWKHVLGAWGECAIARASGIYWCDTTRPDHGAPDVGPFHVRTTDLVDGSLILHDTDADDEPFVLVTLVGLPRFRIVGWCLARDGKRPEWWRSNAPNPAYFVPASTLNAWPVTP